MSDSHPIRNGIVSTVVGGVVLAALGLVWPPAASLIRNLTGALLAPVVVPIWAFLALCVALAALVLKVARRPPRPARTTDQSPIDPSVPPVATAAPTSSLERAILKRLVEADGAPVTFNALLRSTRANRLRLQAELDRLEDTNLLELSDDAADGNPDVYVTARGRQYLVQLGLL